MKPARTHNRCLTLATALTLLCCVVVASLPVAAHPAAPDTVATRSLRHQRTPVNVPGDEPRIQVVDLAGDTLHFASADSLHGIDGIEILAPADSTASVSLGKIRVFNPNPMRAMWLSALCPGLGQIYNRRYWKLPIVVGAFVGLSYGTSWKNRMLTDYTKAYRDAMDSDPDTRSYMDFFAPTVKESELDMDWIKRVMKNKRDYYRRYRDICIISMVGIYLLNIVDAYVDASLAHFDISPDLSMEVRPAVMNAPQVTRTPSVGLQCALNF